MNLNNNSFQSAIILLIGLILTNWIAVINSTPLKTSKLSKHPVVLVVSFDGFRFDYMTKVEMPTFKAIQNEGVSVPYMLAQFPSKTFPNHHSISTGLYPNFHGVIDNNMYDPLNQTAISGKKDDPGFWNYNEDVIPFWASIITLPVLFKRHYFIILNFKCRFAMNKLETIATAVVLCGQALRRDMENSGNTFQLTISKSTILLLNGTLE